MSDSGGGGTEEGSGGADELYRAASGPSHIPGAGPYSTLRSRPQASSNSNGGRIGVENPQQTAEEELSLPELKRWLHSALSGDLLACDVHLSLFVAASHSYKSHSLVQPFPASFLSPVGERLMPELTSCLGSLPPLPSLVRSMRGVPEESLRLLHWLLSAPLSLHSLDRKEAEDVINESCPRGPRPTLVLKVSSPGYKRFLERVGGEGCDLAFHGSRLDNFYSILNSGLQQHRTKSSLFGEGVYLSEELSVSLPYSSQGVAWKGSSLGSILSCVALCQVARGREGVVRAQGQVPEGSQGGKVPDKYLVVRNNELCNIRYLLVYQHSPLGKAASPNRLTAFLCRHKMILLLLTYAFMLASIGFSSSQWFRRWLWKNGFVD